MVQHSFWHQRTQSSPTEPRCPICHNEVRFFLGENVIGWRCYLEHEVSNPVYLPLPPQPCPFPQLHSLQPWLHHRAGLRRGTAPCPR